MNNVPEICISLCGAIILVAAVLLAPLWWSARGAPLRKDWD